MKHVIILEVTATEKQIQEGLGNAFVDFCKKYEGTGITANILTDEAGKKILEIIR